MKKVDKKLIIIIVLSILIIVNIILFLFILKKDIKVEKEEEVIIKDDSEILNEYGKMVEDKISSILNQSGTLLKYEEAKKLVTYDNDIECEIAEVYNDGKLYLEKCTINKQKVSANYGVKQDNVKVEKDVIVVYENKNGGYTFDKPKDIENYKTYKISTGVDYSSVSRLYDNVIYTNMETKKREIRNIKTGDKIFPNINYTASIPLRTTTSYDQTIISLQVNGKWGFYRLKDGKEIVPPIYNSVGVTTYLLNPLENSFDFPVLNEKYIVVKGDNGSGVINYTNNTIIISPQYKDFHQNNNLLWNEDVIFDYYGNSYLKGKYDKIYGVNDNYILLKQGNDIKLLKLDGEELYNYKEINVLEKLHFSYIYDNKIIFEFTNGDKNCQQIIYSFDSKTGNIKEEQCSNIVI